jgi:hypothetical protein
MQSFSVDEVIEYRKNLNMSVSYLDNSNPKDVYESEPVEYKDEQDNQHFKDFKPIRQFSELILPDPR